MQVCLAVRRVDAAFALHGLAPFHADPRPHISVRSCSLGVTPFSCYNRGVVLHIDREAMHMKPPRSVLCGERLPTPAKVCVENAE